jgi:protein-S-isoprenylcysteine O-methyltransferase Ste14
MSLYLEVAGEVLVAIGFLIVFLVYKENTFASATIELAPEQNVISTGLSALVDHPMYMAAMMSKLIWRLFDEEKFLAMNLPGYVEYQKRCAIA